MEQRKNITNVKTNIKGSKSFRIADSAKAFKILSDGIYSDKITAVIRELSTNAYDSHVDAGKKTTPFTVHMPDRYEPFFSVKDAGTGMTHDKVMTLYSEYFGSDKTSSNEFVGALGLGSKSPFAYTDAFSVESIYDGIKNTYSCFINENGFPNIDRVATKDTTQSNGMTITVPVDEKDFYEFSSKAIAIYEVFTTTPVINNMQREYSFTPPIAKYEGKDWRILKKDDSVGVIQGNIYYPLNLDALRTPDIELGYDISNFFEKNGIILNFKIGEVDVTASREALSYDQITIKNIIKKLERIFTHLQKTIQKEVDKIDTFWAARIHYDTINIGGLSLLKINYGDDSIASSYTYEYDGDLVGQIFRYESRSWSNGIERVEVLKTYRSGIQISPSKNTVFIYNNTNKKLTGVALAKQFARDGKRVYYMREANRDLIKAIGSPEVILGSKIPKVEKKKIDVDKRTAKKYFRYDKNTNLATQLTSMSEVPKGRKYFMFTSKVKSECHDAVLYSRGTNHANGTIERLSDLMEMVQNILPKKHTFMLVHKDEHNKKRFTKEKGWVNLIDYIEKHRNKVLNVYRNEIDYITKIGAAKTFVDNYSYDEKSLIRNERIRKEISKNSAIHGAYKTYNMYSKIASMEANAAQEDLKKFASFLGTYMNTSTFFGDFGEKIKYDRMFDRYPMLDHVSGYVLRYDDENDKQITGIIDYINMVDTK